jgi:hypothetical protein
MRKLLILLLIVIGNYSFGQEFPFLEGELLNSEKIKLPEECKGKYTLIGLAYSQKAEAELRTWYDPSVNKFILKRGMFDSEYDVNVFFIPMFHGLNKATYSSSFKKVKQLTDERLYTHVIFYKGNIKGYKESLSIDDKKRPLFFLLDPNGIIIKRFIGKFKESYFEELTEIIDSAQ